jgi:anti-sigma regulatory factor (Ser/Thr protein kinase)
VPSAEFACDAAAVRAARLFVMDEARPEGLDAEMVALLVSELAANAVLHAGTPFTVDVEHDATTLRVAVTDGRAGGPVMKEHSPAAVTGRGLRLVDRIAERWGVEERDSGKTVWFEYTLTGAPA